MGAIVRTDFPRSDDGYDRAAVDAHLEAIAASRTDAALLDAGRAVLERISRLRGELKALSESLREEGLAIAQALDALLELDAPSPGDDDRAVPASPESAPAAAPDDLASARLVALDLALSGASRAEIEAELCARFELADPAGLVDQVLAAIG